MKVGRNDPCPCGSGKKYKRCCMARDKAEQAERMAWERAARNMRVALVGFAREKEFLKDLAAGLGLFWQDRYTLDSVEKMSVDESLRFFDWFAHDYRLEHVSPDSGYRGKRLIKVYREQVADALNDKEKAVLDAWIDSRPGSAFVLQDASPQEGRVVLRDLFEEGRVLTVHDAAAASHGEVGQILLARPLPEADHVRLAGATAVLPAEEEEGLRTFIDAAYKAYVRERAPDSTMGGEDSNLYAEFLRDRAYLFTHYALDWADRMDRPAVAADDPNASASRPGVGTVRKLIRWGQDRVRVP